MVFALADAVLAGADVDVAGGVDGVVAAGNDAAADDVDVAAAGLYDGVTTYGQLGAEGAVEVALTLAFLVCGADGGRPFACVEVEAAAFAGGALAMAVAGKAEVDVVFGMQEGVAFGCEARAFAVDAAIGGDDVEVAAGAGLSGNALAGMRILGLMATLVVQGGYDWGAGCLIGAGCGFACLHAAT